MRTSNTAKAESIKQNSESPFKDLFQGEDQKLTPRAHETRAKLLAAARDVFGCKGYLNTTVEDIVLKAGVARGTFYLYFRNKERIFEHLLNEVVEQMYREAASPSQGNLLERIEKGNEGYLKVFYQNRDIMRILLELATSNPHFAEIYKNMRSRFIARIQRNIEKNIQKGNYRQVDPVVASHALGGMVEWFAYWCFVADENLAVRCGDLKQIAHTLSSLWYHSLARSHSSDPCSN